MQDVEKGSGGFWKLLNTPLVGTQSRMSSDVLEWGNLLALLILLINLQNMVIVMLFLYDFPLTEKDLRAYIPNVLFGKAKEVKMKRFGSFWRA